MGKRRILITLSGLIFFLISTGYSQQKCFTLHLDKFFYVSGETIWFKVYTGEKHSNRIMYADLISHQNVIISSQKLLIQDHMTYGSILLPMNAKEGYYRLRFFSNQSTGEDQYLHETDIPVFNLENENYSTGDLEKTEQSIDSKISIITNKEVYVTRDSLKITITLDETKSNFSMAVVPADVTGIITFSDCSKNDSISANAPKGESLTLESELLDMESGKGVTSGLISIYLNKNTQFLRASSLNGKLTVNLPDFWGREIFQILNLDPYQPSVGRVVQIKKNVNKTRYTNPTPPTRTAPVQNYISQLKIRRKVLEMYKDETELNDEIQEISRIPDATYFTNDFINIASFEEFINEAILNVKVRQIDGVKSVRLFNPEYGRLFMDQPWYIVDGYLTFDENEVLEIDYKDIVEVRLFSKTSTIKSYFEPFMQRNGVMEIITRDVKYNRKIKNEPNVVELEGFTKPRDFEKTLFISDDIKTPDLRGLLFWIPSVNTDENGEAQLSIPLSDDKGEFSIQVMGVVHSDVVYGSTNFLVK